MATLDICLGRTDAAEKRYLRVIELRKRTFGEADPRFAASLFGLTALHAIRGDLAKDEELLRGSASAHEIGRAACAYGLDRAIGSDQIDGVRRDGNGPGPRFADLLITPLEWYNEVLHRATIILPFRGECIDEIQPGWGGIIIARGQRPGHSTSRDPRHP